MQKKAHNPRSTTAQSRLLQHVIEILSHLVHSPRSLGVSEIADHLGLAKSTAYRLLGAMVEQNLARKEPGTRRYSLNPQVFSSIHQLAISFGPAGRFTHELRKLAADMKMSIYVTILCGGNTYVVAASGTLGDTFALGEQAPVYASSAGKAVVSQYPRERWVEFAPDASAKLLTRHTNTDPERFYKELERARENGVAWNHRESSLDAISVAAPIHEPGRDPRFAVAILLAEEQSFIDDRIELEQKVRKIAKKLELS